MKRLRLTPFTRKNFAPFGEAIILDEAPHYPINAGTTERFHALAKIDAAEAGGTPIISLFRGQPFALPLTIKLMERHPLGSQAFIPVTQNPQQQYLVIVSPPGNADAASIATGLKAFLLKGFQGVSYARGVWHHPLISLGQVSDFVVVDRAGPGENCDEVVLDGSISVDID